MSNYPVYKAVMAELQITNALLMVFTWRSMPSYAYALGTFLADLENNLEKFCGLWNMALELSVLVQEPLPTFDSADLQVLADMHGIPLTFAADGTVSVSV